MRMIVLAAVMTMAVSPAVAASAELAEQVRAGLADAGISARPVLGDAPCLQERYCQMDVGEENMMVTVRGQTVSVSQADADRGQYTRACAATFSGLTGSDLETSELFFDALFDETAAGTTNEGALEGVEVTLQNGSVWECSFYKP